MPATPSESASEQKRKLQSIEIGATLQRLDGIGVLIATVLHDGDELDSSVIAQFRATIARLSHLVEAAVRDMEVQPNPAPEVEQGTEP